MLFVVIVTVLLLISGFIVQVGTKSLLLYTNRDDGTLLSKDVEARTVESNRITIDRYLEYLEKMQDSIEANTLTNKEKQSHQILIDYLVSRTNVGIDHLQYLLEKTDITLYQITSETTDLNLLNEIEYLTTKNRAYKSILIEIERYKDEAQFAYSREHNVHPSD